MVLHYLIKTYNNKIVYEIIILFQYISIKSLVNYKNTEVQIKFLSVVTVLCEQT